MTSRVSALVVTHNHARCIEEAVTSALRQSHPPTEVVVINDGSIDDTVACVRTLGDSRIRVVELAHRGIAALFDTYNVGIGTCRGELVAILEGDDRWPNDKLDRQVNAFEDSGVVIAHGLYSVIGAKGARILPLNGRYREARVCIPSARTRLLAERTAATGACGGSGGLPCERRAARTRRRWPVRVPGARLTMCGIAGLVTADARNAQPRVAAMLARLVHRGPDDEGIESSTGASLGARRLAIIDLAGGHQPMRNEDGTVIGVQNGEIYNFEELRWGLVARGHRLVTHSDTEVLPHLYEEHGPGFVRHLRGMFALALWDTKAKRLVLARDRLGKKPLVYSRTAGELAFASELQHCSRSRRFPAP